MPSDEHQSYPYRASGEAFARADAESVWRLVSSIGGENRYFVLNPLWSVREVIDALIGGEGLVRRRPGGHVLRPGDRIDSWTVLVADAPRRLALLFGMKAPGRGVLEFVIEPDGGRTRLSATAFWKPDGLAGRLYWWAMEPAHLVLFASLTREICRRAELEQARAGHGRLRAAATSAKEGASVAVTSPQAP